MSRRELRKQQECVRNNVPYVKGISWRSTNPKTSFDEEDLTTAEGRIMVSNQIWRRIDLIVAESMAEFSDDLADSYERKQAIAIGSLSTDVDFDFTKRGRFFNPEAKDSQDILRKDKNATPIQASPKDNGGSNHFEGLEINNSEDSLDEDVPFSILDRNDSEADLDLSGIRAREGIDTPGNHMVKNHMVKSKVSRSTIIKNLIGKDTHSNDLTFSDEAVGDVAFEMEPDSCYSIDPVASALGALDLFAEF